MTTEPGNQFLITEPVENNTTTYENNKTATTTTTETFSTESAENNTTTTEVAANRLETPQKLGKKHNKNEKVF
jgi:hypothetical protein